MNVMGGRPGDKERLVNTKATKTSPSLVSFAQQVPYGLFTSNCVCYLTQVFFIFNQKEVINFMVNFNFHIINVFKKISEMSSCLHMASVLFIN